MSMLTLPREDEEARLAHARDWLYVCAPELSSKRLLSKGQRNAAILFPGLIVIGCILSPLRAGIVLVGTATALYLAILVSRVAITLRSLRHPNLVEVSADEALALSEQELPIYTVLVPLYREAKVIPELVTSLRALEYPQGRLDVKLLVEQDDDETLAAVLAVGADDFDVVVVPEGAPRTKPRALNYGLTLARGDLVTIYDAEDRPDPLQLRKAVVAFRQLPDRVGCLQAKLDYWNSEQNLITRWFGTEYVQWFRLLLPGLAASGAPVPLGGTSNHIRRDLLEAVGAWDPYNVTEDADLGIRLHRAGYRCVVLDSTTWEEANSDYVNWNNQRSRWYKGYLQTWLVHMRRPARLIEELGWRGWFEFSAFVCGTPALALMNLMFWALTIAWFAGHVNLVKELFPAAVYYPALFSFVFGNVVLAYLYVISARLSARSSLVWTACLVPLYWLMMGIAALKAFWQLFVGRTFWEKTLHGLAGQTPQTESAVAQGALRQAAVPAFALAVPPALAIGIVSSNPRAWRSSSVWRSVAGRVCRSLGMALLAFVLYVVLLSGILPAGAAPAGFVDRPLSRDPAGGATLARVVFPELGIDQLVVQGTSRSEMNRDVGHLPGTALPGDEGDAVIVGHRVAYGASFSRLPGVRVGDEAIVETGGGRALYRVYSVTVQSSRQLVLGPESEAQLTIVTSAGSLDPDGLLVVRTTLVHEDGVRFTGSAATFQGNADVPGVDWSWIVVALVWFGIALVGWQAGRFVRRRSAPLWVMAPLVLVVVVAVFEMCLSGARALPVTL